MIETESKNIERVIQEQIRSGIVQVVENPESLWGPNTLPATPHSDYRQDKETTKLRIVYDASARTIP